MFQRFLDIINLGDFYRRMKSVTPLPDIYIGILASSFFINLLGLVFPIFLLIIYDRIIPRHSINTLIILGLGVFSALFLEAILRIARSKVSAWSDARFEYFTTGTAFNHLLHSKITEFERFSASYYLEHMNAIYTLKSFFGGQALLIMIDIPFAMIYIALIFYLAGPLVLIPVIMLILFIFSTYTISKRLSDDLKKKYQADDKRISFVVSILNGIHTIKAMAIENPIIRRYERLQESSTSTGYRVGLTGGRASIMANLCTQTATALVVGIGAYWVISHHLSIGGLAASILLAGRAMQPIGRAIEVLTRLESIRLAEKRIEAVKEIPLEKTKKMTEIPLIKGEIEFKNVGFRYANTEQWIFKNLNMHINEKESVGIQGSNFSGKSTFLWMIFGLLEPQKGEILIDGQNISQFNPKSVRSKMAYLPQKGVLFNGTILDNLTMFRPEMAAKAKETSVRLGLDQDIQRLPLGYETLVGKHAVEHISPGLKQRVSFTRAFVDEPKIILFDEANRFVDFETDHALKLVLSQYKGQCTMIIVSNRPSMLSVTNRQYHIQDGNMQETDKNV